MKPPIVELMFTPISRADARYALPGARRAALVYDGTLNRVPVWYRDGRVTTDLRWDLDANHCNPPDPAALAACASLLRNPVRAGLGAGAIEVFLDLESSQSLPQITGAVRVLRSKLGKSAKVSIFGFPQYWNESTDGFADALAEVTALAWGLYPGNNVLAYGWDTWFAELAEAEAQARRLCPRRRKVMFATPVYQIDWLTDPFWSKYAPLNNTPMPLDRWRAVLVRLLAGGWEIFMWGGPVPGTEPHVAVAAEVCGLAGAVVSVPPVDVVG